MELYQAIRAHRDLDFASARHLYTALADKGDHRALFALAQMHWLGQGGPVDVDTAIQRYREAAEAGSVSAMLNLAGITLRGEGLTPDLAQSVRWARRAALLGDTDAQFALGVRYARGEGVAREMDQARRWWLSAAERGHPEAAFCLGQMLEVGDGVPASPVAAARWYVAAGLTGHPGATQALTDLAGTLTALAEQADPQAMTVLGQMYTSGLGIPEDRAVARQWYAQAAAQGHAPAKQPLAILLRDGEGGPVDLSGAYQLVQEAAEAGDVAAAHDLGLMFEQGLGVAADLSAALRWYRVAAEAEAPVTWTTLALALAAHGEAEEGRAWLQRSAEAGYGPGMLILGVWCREGVGGPEDLPAALRWLFGALRCGLGDALDQAAPIARDAPWAWLAEADRLAGGDGSLAVASRDFAHGRRAPAPSSLPG